MGRYPAQNVLIVGGGLAGLAAAVALAPRGCRVTLLEARPRLGGRASSFHDPSTGQLIDACQHVTLGCCTNFAHWCMTVGIDGFLAPQKTLTFQTPDGCRSRFRADALPAPWHLARSFLTAHFLTPLEKLRIGYGLACLRWHEPKNDPPFHAWLIRHHQTPRTIDRFWGLVLVSALNEAVDRVGLRYARKVFLDGFLGDPRGFEVQIPNVPLGRLYGEELLGWLRRHDVTIHFQRTGKRFHVDEKRVIGLETRQGETLEADWYISTVPFDRLLDLLPDDVIERHDYFRNLRNLESSPITSVHLWFDRPVLDLPHVVLVDCLGQWVFNRGAQTTSPIAKSEPFPPPLTKGGPGGGGTVSQSPNAPTLPGPPFVRGGESLEYYVQIVVSAARQLRALGHDEVQRQIVEEFRKLFPPARAANLVRARVVTEHAATFSAVPGVDRWRPAQTSPIENLLVAGDWTATSWPATMEGAVRSGYLAAEVLLRKIGRETRLVQADL